MAFRTESKNRGFFVIMGVDLHGDEVWIDDGADKMGDGIRMKDDSLNYPLHSPLISLNNSLVNLTGE